jgi:YfiH family protein
MHGFSTTALGTMGLNSAPDPGLVMSRRFHFSRGVGFELEAAAFAVQVHGKRVHAFKRDGKPPAGQSVLATDGLASNVPGQALVTYHADCYPVIFVDQAHGAVGVAHVGWRGAVRGIIPSMLSTMHAAYRSDSRGLSVLVGPGICANCYPVGEEVSDQFTAAFGPSPGFLRRKNEQLFLDIKGVVRQQLLAGGVRGQAIQGGDWCTREDPAWFSHRAGREGRFLAAVVVPADVRRNG